MSKSDYIFVILTAVNVIISVLQSWLFGQFAQPLIQLSALLVLIELIRLYRKGSKGEQI